MKKLFLAGCLSLGLARLASGQDNTYENDGLVTNLINVDAINFVNTGLFAMPINGSQTNILLNLFDYVSLNPTTTAYTFSDVQNFTNTGEMACDVGFIFNTFPSSFGSPHPAASFFNGNTGFISAGSLTNMFSTPNFLIDIGVSPKLEIAASNVVNTGILDAGLGGLMTVDGQNVDLSYGTINMEGFDTGLAIITGGIIVATNASGTNIFGTNANGIVSGFLDVGIFSQIWGIGSQINLLSVTNFELPQPSTAISLATNYLSQSLQTQLIFGNPFVFANTELDATNDTTYQAVFVQDTLGQVGISVGFEPTITTNGTNNPFAVPVIQYQATATNLITGLPITNAIYVADVFGAATNLQLLTNISLTLNPVTLPVPANYAITRTFPGFDLLPAGDTNYDISLFTNAFGTNGLQSTTNTYSVLWANVATSTFEPDPTLPGQTITNIGGRIEISASNVLNLTGTIMDGPNYVSLTATNHFAGSAGARMVFPVGDINLRSSNGLLTITNVLAPNIPRINGPVDLYSARWTNLTQATNLTVDTNGNTTTNRFTMTNRFHVLMALSSLAATSPAFVKDLKLQSTNGGGSIVINDILDVTNSMFIDTQSLTIASNGPASFNPTGQLNLQNQSLVWSSSLSTNLHNLTNWGIITMPNTVYFQKRLTPNFPSAGDGPYSNLVNHSLISSGGGDLAWTGYFENTGPGSNPATITASVGPIYIQAATALLTNGLLSAPLGGISFSNNSLTISNHALQASGALTFAVTNLVTDGVAPLNRYGLNVTNLPTNVISSNVWSAAGGLNLLFKPAAGDLLGTTITVTAPANPPQTETWAGADRGVSASGFANNTALGHLKLIGTSTNSVFHFEAASPATSNALYVDLLELQNGATNRANVGGTNVFTALNVDPNMTIYFAGAVIGNQDISEKLNGANGGRLLWVSNYAGLYSSTNVAYPDGRVFAFNRALRSSLTIDSDGDGIVNGIDPTPFPEPPPTPSSIGLTITQTNQAALISWQTQPFNTNTVYYRTLANTNWQVLTTFVSGPAYGRTNVTDPIATNRLYKVRIDPAH